MAYSLRRPRRGLTLIEMLVATAITLLMMAAVVNLFANLSGSIRNRRAVIEISGQLRQVRQRLALDLAGATCPAVPWQRPGDDVGYFEIIEGGWTDQNPSALVDGDATVVNGELNDYAASQLPRNNLVLDYNNDGTVDDDDAQAHLGDQRSLALGGLGDYDDVLALTVRSEAEPFVVQDRGDTVQSPVAEVMWFAVENPANGLLGEPGLRTIYRRVLAIAPWRNPIAGPPDPDWYYQRYDISAHYDFANSRWIPNTLSDLTKRENRAFHQPGAAAFPHVMASGGAGYSGNSGVSFTRTPLDNSGGANGSGRGVEYNGAIVAYIVDDAQGGGYDDLPAAVVSGSGGATARPVMAQLAAAPNPLWTVAAVTFGPAPLSIHRVPNATGGGSFIVDRTGDDVMLTGALAFDVRVFDPGAPVYQAAGAEGVLVQPGDPGFDPTVAPGTFGAYVDLGWQPFYPANLDKVTAVSGTPRRQFDMPRQVGWLPRNEIPAANFTVYPFGWPATYDTWSLHYESDGLDQDNATDGAAGVDQGTNGLDDDNANGADDAAERETSPPYSAALRGVQVRLRVYESDSRQIRETSVTRSLVK